MVAWEEGEKCTPYFTALPRQQCRAAIDRPEDVYDFSAPHRDLRRSARQQITVTFCDLHRKYIDESTHICYPPPYMQHTSLQQFITHARSKGMDHQTIRMLLLSAGWKDREILMAMSEESLDMDLPMPEDRGGAREAFLHLLAFAFLYSSIVSVLVLVFQYLNRLFPDVAFDPAYYDGDRSLIQWFLAMLIVSFPLFAWMSRIIMKDIEKNPERAWSPIRRWLTYLTLFVTAGVLVGDGITLLFYLLQGEITIRFLLKVAVVVLVAGITFSYYFLSLKSLAAQSRLHRSFAIPAWIIVLVVVVWGMFYAGTPLSERERRLDEVRVENLRAIQNEIYNIVYDNRRYEPTRPTELPRPLPTSLTAVADNAVYQKLSITDPVSGEPYGYTVDGTNFQLCAVFATVRDQAYDIFWNHPAGEHCYEFDGLDPAGK